MNPTTKYNLICSNGDFKGTIRGRLNPDIEIALLGMAMRTLQSSSKMKGMRLDRFTITLVMPKPKKKSRKFEASQSKALRQK